MKTRKKTTPRRDYKFGHGPGAELMQLHTFCKRVRLDRNTAYRMMAKGELKTLRHPLIKRIFMDREDHAHNVKVVRALIAAT